MDTKQGNKLGVYKLRAGDRIYYRVGNGATDAQERLHKELEKRLGNYVLVPEIVIMSKERQ